MFYEVMVAGTGGGEGVFTYEYKPEVVEYGGDKAPNSLSVGQIVEVPLRRGKTVGVVVKKVAQPDFTTKAIMRIIYSKPLPTHLLKTAQFVSEYYQAPLPSCVGLLLPKGVEKQRRTRGGQISALSARSRPPVVTGDASLDCSSLVANGLKNANSDRNETASNPSPEQNRTKPNGTEKTEHFDEKLEIRLNQAQKNALEGLSKAPGATKLLHGVTGSGKTNIYLEMAARALKTQKSVVLLVPEIALTGQLVRVFGEVFHDKVRLIHSGQTEVERHLIFEEILNSSEPLIVVGPRSALFAPLNNLGLIIIDEEHEATYIQENAPRYSAIRVASYMAKVCKCECVLGSATPTVTDYYVASEKDAVVTLKEKAKRGAKKADIRLIDFKNREEFSRNRYFSNSLLRAISKSLSKGHQTLIFHNRRGSAPLTICDQCGAELTCPNCLLPLTLHADSYEMVCHTCEHHEKVPWACPKCGGLGLVHKGFGTKLLESELKRVFPNAKVRRFDADNKKGEALEDVYDEVREGGVDILVGTQTLAKGLDLPLLSTVGVVQADAGLSLPDFAAEERSFQLLTQVIGRVGRGHLETAEVYIQTFRPEHPVINFAMKEDYEGFYKYMLGARRKGQFPPFMFVAACEVTAKTETTVLRKVRAAAATLAQDERLLVSPPMPAFHEHTARGYTWGLVVRAKSRTVLVEALKGLDQSWKITLDPASLL